MTRTDGLTSNIVAARRSSSASAKGRYYSGAAQVAAAVHNLHLVAAVVAVGGAHLLLSVRQRLGEALARPVVGGPGPGQGAGAVGLQLDLRSRGVARTAIEGVMVSERPPTGQRVPQPSCGWVSVSTKRQVTG